MGYLVVDLFCGAGGTTTGFTQAHNYLGEKFVKVVACVNHDYKAIHSHWANHKTTKHFLEDIKKLDMTELLKVVNKYRKKFPGWKLILWASLECTNFSKAKGGQPKDADSRTLAYHLYRYIDALNPDYVMIENVVEFMAWGPMTTIKVGGDEFSSEIKWMYDKKKKKEMIAYRPITMRNGEFWKAWCDEINKRGYHDEWQEMNSADFGAHTSRNRLFGCFARIGQEIHWPQTTHSKGNWRPVYEVLDLDKVGKSIVYRDKLLSENTYARIYEGLIRYVKTGDGLFIQKYYGTGANVSSIWEPVGTLTTKDRMYVMRSFWLDKQYTGKENHSSITKPAGTILRNDKHQVMEARGFIFNPSHGGHPTALTKACPTLIARQDKAPLYLIDARRGKLKRPKKTSPMLDKILDFMEEHQIVDITMRSLDVEEMLRIQGFPSDYIMTGTQTDNKRGIGNSVAPIVVTEWIKTIYEKEYVKHRRETKRVHAERIHEYS